MTKQRNATDPGGCLYCGGIFAVLLVTLGDGRRVAAHPSCVAAALERDPGDATAREIAASFGMPEGRDAQGGGHVGWQRD